MSDPSVQPRPAAAPGAAFSWSVHPARERRGRALAAGAVILLLALGAGRLGGHPGWVGLAGATLLLALNRFFFPSRFAIDAEGITARYPLARRRYRWQELRRFVHDRRGGYLSTRDRASRLDAYRGMHLLFGARSARVIREIRAHLATEGSAWGG